MFGNKDEEILHELRAIHGELKLIGVAMSLDFSKLQAADAAIAAEVSTLVTTIQTESAAIQAAIDKLAAASGSNPADQATRDPVTADLNTSHTNLTAAAASVTALPTTPTPPAAPSA